MPARKTAPRRTGSGSAKAVASLPLTADSSGEAQAERLCFLPTDPDDERLTLDGVRLDVDGKVDILAYEDLMPSFAGEPSPDQHPDPERPGVRHGEHVPKGLRMWDDVRAGAENKDGAGWIAVRCAAHEKKQEKWFNIRTCKSWRMAFLLARLQRQAWDRRAAWLKQSVAAPSGKAPLLGGEGATAGVSASAPSVEHADGAKAPPATVPSVDGPTTPKHERSAEPLPRETPKPKRARPKAEGEDSQKRARRGGQDAKAAPQPEQQPKKACAVGADTWAMWTSSSRVQQILAARQKQQQQ
eukprot:CAMPEP_0117563436 /NCGR_PEP_ID=MMETSP0784-20121206/55495_1 /TAXON_ID=39447 /ORGANISM="" /LENGTH=298 /DNA_ID=CAMNT_0005361085 /DNA_START=18 /DNA_END=914 /DNA_ORIENTATION=+